MPWSLAAFSFCAILPHKTVATLVYPLFSPYTNKISQPASGVMAALIGHKNSPSSNSEACLEVSLHVSWTFIWWDRKWEKNAGRETQTWNVLYFSVFIAHKIFYILILFVKNQTANWPPGRPKMVGKDRLHIEVKSGITKMQNSWQKGTECLSIFFTHQGHLFHLLK